MGKAKNFQGKNQRPARMERGEESQVQAPGRTVSERRVADAGMIQKSGQK
jgi:hypothetical protein